MSRTRPVVNILALLVLVSACREAGPARGSVHIHTSAGATVNYKVEVARSDADRSHGLMFRNSLQEGDGMLFIFEPAREVAMWMKNTLLPLDMLFIASGGRIVKIAANTVPRSTDRIYSESSVVAVLELNAGQAVRRGIEVGDRVEWQGSE
jgi:uncharacterized membrane protein (UPF0127 family)